MTSKSFGISDTRRTALIVCLTLAGLTWRALMSLWLVPAWEASSNYPPFPDHYPSLAQSIIHSGVFGFGAEGAEISTVRGPGYPLWLAMGLVIGGGSSGWLGVWSSLPMLLLAPFILLRAWDRFGPIPAVLLYMFLLFQPIASINSSRSMSDEFYATLGFATILLWGRALAFTGRRAVLLASGATLCASFALITRSTAIIFIVIPLLLTFLHGPRYRRVGVVLAIVAVVPALLWSVRSSRLEGRPVFVHSMMAYNFWLGEGFDRYGDVWSEGQGWNHAQELFAREGDLTQQEMHSFYYTQLSPRELARLESRLSQAAIRRITNDPLGYGLRFIRGIYRFWLAATSPARTRQYALMFLPVALLLIPLIRPANLRPLVKERLFVASLIVILAHNIAYAGFCPMARHAVQVYPELAWLMAAGSHAILKPLSGLRTGLPLHDAG